MRSLVVAMAVVLPLGSTAYEGWHVAAAEVETPKPAAPAQTEPVEARRIDKLIRQLGDKDYDSRQGAQDELARLRFNAFDALMAATTNDDLEIAARAKYLLRLIWTDWTIPSDPPEVKRCLQDMYVYQEAQVREAQMRKLVNLPNGIGLAALCRLVRFENSVYSKTAVVTFLLHGKVANQPTTISIEIVRKALRGCKRPGAVWLLAWTRLDSEPEAVLAEWAKLADDEMKLLQKSNVRNKTSLEIVAGLSRFQLAWLKKLGKIEEAMAAVRRMVEVGKLRELGDPNRRHGNRRDNRNDNPKRLMAELLRWLIEQKAWKAVDEVAQWPRFAAEPELLYSLAEAYAKQGRQDEAEKTAEQAFRLYPGKQEEQLLRHLQMAQQLRRKQSAWALRELEYVIAQCDANMDKRTKLARKLPSEFRWLIRQQEWKTIDKMVQRFAPYFAAKSNLLYELAGAYAEQGRKDEAEKTAEQAFRLYPGKQQKQLLRHLNMARQLRSRKQFVWALREIEYVIAQGGAVLELERGRREKPLAELLFLLIGQKAWKDVDEVAQRFASHFAADPNSLYLLAEAYAVQGRKDEAEKTAEQAFRLYPGKQKEHLLCRLKMARQLRSRRPFAETLAWALREFEYVIAQCDADVDERTKMAQTMLREFYWLIGQKAWKAVDELARRFPRRFAADPILLYKLAGAYAEQGRKDEAEKTAEQAFRLYPGKQKEHLLRRLNTARQLRGRGQSAWALREIEYVIAQGKDAEVARKLPSEFQWLIRQKEWKIIDKMAQRFATHFATEPRLLYKLAGAYAEQGRKDEAEKTAEQAFRLYPGKQQKQLLRHLRMAQQLRSRKQFAWARREFEHVIAQGGAVLELERGRRHHRQEKPLAELISLLIGQKAWKDVDELAQRFASHFAADPNSLYKLAEAYAEQGRKDEAEKTAERAFRLYPDKQEKHLLRRLNMARQLHYRKQFAWALREFEYVITQYDANVDGRAEVARKLLSEFSWLIRQKEWKTIDELARRFMPRFATEPRSLYLLAEAYAVQGRKDEAEKTAEQAFQLNPGKQRRQLSHHLGMAQPLRGRGQFAWARREFEYVIDQGGDNEVRFTVRARLPLAEILHDQGQDLHAAAVLEKLVRAIDAGKVAEAELQGRKPNKVRARMHYFFACHWEANNDAAKQREHLDKAFQADPKNVDVLIACHRLPDQPPERRAKIVERINSIAAKLRERIAKHPKSPSAYDQYAWLIGNTEGDFDEALRFALKAVKLHSRSADYHNTLAHLYFVKGDLQNAVEHQTKAAELKPHSGLICRKLEFFRKKLEEK